MKVNNNLGSRSCECFAHELKQAQIDNSVDTRLTVQGHMFLVAKKIMPNIVAVIIVKYTSLLLQQHVYNAHE